MVAKIVLLLLDRKERTPCIARRRENKKIFPRKLFLLSATKATPQTVRELWLVVSVVAQFVRIERTKMLLA